MSRFLVDVIAALVVAAAALSGCRGITEPAVFSSYSEIGTMRVEFEGREYVVELKAKTILSDHQYGDAVQLTGTTRVLVYLDLDPQQLRRLR